MHPRLAILFCITVTLAGGCKTKEIPPSSHSNPAVMGAAPVTRTPKDPMTAMTPPPMSVTPPVVTNKPAPKIATPPKLAIPSDPIAKARLFISLGYGRSALATLKSKEGELSSEYSYWLLRAKAAHLCNEPKEAQKAVRLGLTKAQKPSEKQALQLVKGLSLMTSRKYNKAQKVLTTALELDPANTPVRLALIQVLQTKKRTSRLSAILSEGLKLTPGEGLYHLAQGELLYLNRDRKGAIARFNSIASDTKFKGYIRAKAMDRAGTIIAERSKAEARKVVTRCRKFFPTYGCVHTEMLIAAPDPRHPWRKIKNVKRSLYSMKK